MALKVRGIHHDPVLVGVAEAPTPPAGDSSTLIATTEFVTTAVAASLDTLGEVAGTFGGIGIPTVFLQMASESFVLGSIDTAETEAGPEFRQQRYLVGAGVVRLVANVRLLVGSPTLRLKYSTDAFSSTVTLLSWTPTGTGLQYSAWVAMPDGAKADVGLSWYTADGGGTAELYLNALNAEFLPAVITGTRDFSDDWADDYS